LGGGGRRNSIEEINRDLLEIWNLEEQSLGESKKRWRRLKFLNFL